MSITLCTGCRIARPRTGEFRFLIERRTVSRLRLVFDLGVLGFEGLRVTPEPSCLASASLSLLHTSDVAGSSQLRLRL